MLPSSRHTGVWNTAKLFNVVGDRRPLADDSLSIAGNGGCLDLYGNSLFEFQGTHRDAASAMQGAKRGRLYKIIELLSRLQLFMRTTEYGSAVKDVAWLGPDLSTAIRRQ